jgi:hypothetical protein
MTYFGVSSDRYGGWSQKEKKEEMKNAELPPGREPCSEDD